MHLESFIVFLQPPIYTRVLNNYYKVRVPLDNYLLNAVFNPNNLLFVCVRSNLIADSSYKREVSIASYSTLLVPLP